MRFSWLILATVGDPYVIESTEGRLTAKVAAAGLLSGFGHEHTLAIRAFSGEVRLSDRGLEGGTVWLAIRADSVAESGEEFSEEERKKIDRDVHAKVLEVSKHPAIDFRGTAVSAAPLGENRYRVRIEGTLSLHGVTRPLTISADVGPRGDVLSVRGKFAIKHSKYGLERLSAAAGLVKAADEITFSFDVLARRQIR